MGDGAELSAELAVLVCCNHAFVNSVIVRRVHPQISPERRQELVPVERASPTQRRPPQHHDILAGAGYWEPLFRRAEDDRVDGKDVVEQFLDHTIIEIWGVLNYDEIEVGVPHAERPSEERQRRLAQPAILTSKCRPWNARHT